MPGGAAIDEHDDTKEHETQSTKARMIGFRIGAVDLEEWIRFCLQDADSLARLITERAKANTIGPTAPSKFLSVFPWTIRWPCPAQLRVRTWFHALVPCPMAPLPTTSLL